MGKKTVKTPFENNTEYKWMDVPETADYRAFKDMPILADPSIGYRAARDRRDFMNTFQNPLGSATTPEMREQLTRAGLMDLATQEGQAQREASFDLNKLRMAKGESLMNFSRPILTTPKEWGYGTQQKEGGGILNSVIGGAATLGSAYINKKRGA